MKKKLVRIVLMVVAIIIILFLVVINITSLPEALLIRLLFANPNPKPLNEYKDMKEEVRIIKNIEYPSKYKENLLDIYLPKNEEDQFPVIIWVHGGAFAGGDKTDMKYYGEALAIDGYAVVSINYMRAPEGKYPVPIMQISEVYNWMISEKDNYKFNIENLIFAGDSAGAQMVAQFVTIQTNMEYSNFAKIAQTVDSNHIKATLLYCGIYDIKNIEGVTESKILKYLFNKVGWSYFGNKNWKEDFKEELTITNYINENYPATFITDGNTYSFEKQGRELANKLRERNIIVKEYYIPVEKKVTFHEYQFKMDTKQGEEVYKEVIEFLNELQLFTY